MCWVLACLVLPWAVQAATPVDSGVAWKELLATLADFEAPAGDLGFRVCFLGHEPHTLELALQLLTLPEPYVSQLPRPLKVALLRASATILEETREAIAEHGDERLQVLVPEEQHLFQPGSCDAVVLAAFAARPVVDLSPVASLVHAARPWPTLSGSQASEGVFLLAHFGASCGPGDHGCRSLQTAWRDVAGEAASCGRHFCGAAVTPEALMNVNMPSIDCDGMINSASAQSDASQWQQDWFVYKNFFRGSSLDVAGAASGDRQGVFVDVGAFHPIHLSNTYFFERCLGWRGLCVEPNPSMHKYFEAYRPSCELVKNCVWSHPRRVVMSFQKDPIEAYIREDETHDGSQTDSSGSSGAVKITGGGSRPEFVAECRTLKDILASQGLGRPKLVDFLSVDAEAAEVEIFRDFPFDEFDIQVINVEVQAKNYYDLDNIILNAGYAKIAVLGGDHVYAKLDFALKFPARMAAWRQALAKDFWSHEAPKTAVALNSRAGGPSA
mmetsp:Transcript_41400/g.89758  ORF Transcript_41400/g.89758 Transcript_41400/m.89758 type:complete len:498 (+) Transcript_41400:69-1562(+)